MRGGGVAGKEGRGSGARLQQGCGDGGVGGQRDGGTEGRLQGGVDAAGCSPPKFAGGDDRFQANAHLSCPNYTAGDEEQTPLS